MEILLSNDDGVYAQGIAVLANALQSLGKVIIIAPDRNRSGASNSLSLDRPLRIKHLPNGAISVEGTPTDCVHLGITGLLDKLPTMVVSGINEGSNLGDDTIYSGTVAAATEGRYLGLPAMAISLAGECKHYHTAAEVAKQVILRFMQNPLPKHTILNVNVPDVPYSELKGFEVTRLGKRHIAEKVIKAKDPRGKDIYWIGAAGPEEDAGEGTDFYAINQNKVSITPIKIDLTHHEAIDDLKVWVEGLGDQ